MAKRTKRTYASKLVEDDEEKDEVEVAEEPKTSYNSTKKRLQLKISAKVIVREDMTKSGKRYIWERAGAIVEVEDEDVPGLLEKRLGNATCCGGDPENLKIFALVE